VADLVGTEALARSVQASRVDAGLVEQTGQAHAARGEQFQEAAHPGAGGMGLGHVVWLREVSGLAALR
jgi:hypothetical protein